MKTSNHLLAPAGLSDPDWTPRQREVLALLVARKTNGEIAGLLGISLDGAKWHVSEIIAKLGVESREEAAEYWRAHNGLRRRFARVLRAVAPTAAWARIAGATMTIVAAGAVVAIVAIRVAQEQANSDEVPTAGLAVVTPVLPAAAGSAGLPDATPAANVTLPTVWGDFGVLPNGSVPSQADLSALAPGRSQQTVRHESKESLAECAAFPLSIPAATLSGAWVLDGCTQDTIVWDDASTLTFNYTAMYAKDGQPPFALYRRLLVPGAPYEVVSDAGRFATSLGRVAGSEAVFMHAAPGSPISGPFTVYFSGDGVLTQVEASGMDFASLLAAAEELAARARH